MPGEWEVIEDKTIHNGKRYVKIYDKPNKREYSNYFPSGVTDTAIKNRFKAQVQEHRAELARPKSGLDFTNFEAGL